MNKRFPMKRALAISTLAAVAGLGGTLWASAPAGRFTVGTDTVTDNHTGLVWQRTVDYWSSDGLVWESAMTHCQQLDLGGYSSGWRLPTVKELSSLIDDSTGGPAIDSVAFPNTPDYPCWTSTEDAGDSFQAWTVEFGTGEIYAYEKLSAHIKERCVH